jgi:hypothetical protein
MHSDQENNFIMNKKPLSQSFRQPQIRILFMTELRLNMDLCWLLREEPEDCSNKRQSELLVFLIILKLRTSPKNLHIMQIQCNCCLEVSL